MPGKRGARWFIHSLFNAWSLARRDVRAFWLTARVGSPTGTIRRSWRRSRARRHNARTDFGNRAYDGTHRAGPIVHGSSIACRDRGHFGLAPDRATLNLRRALI